MTLSTKQQAKLAQTMMRNERKGHAETTITDAEWAKLFEHRQRQFEDWQKLTQKLFTGGVLDTDEWGEPVLNLQRPQRWVYDESEDEYEQRMRELALGKTA